jgi:leader peptidase (prepilin peptidase)/N-methyltransferase
MELAVGALWIGLWTKFGWPLYSTESFAREIPRLFVHAWIILTGYALLSWLLLALAALDAEHFWLPDLLTFPGIALGLAFTLSRNYSSPWSFQTSLFRIAENSAIAILASAAIVLVIRLAYWLIRRKEGMGLGDAKLMAMLGAWLGLRGALESFAFSVFAALLAALIWLAILAARRNSSEWAKMPLPLGTFLCLGALTEIFYPGWLWTLWASWPHVFGNY